MMNEKILSAMNTQINEEFYAAYLYLSMSAYYESVGLTGFAKWMREQSKEEVKHAMRFYDFIYERGGTVTLLPVGQPKLKWENIIEPFQDAYAHEQKVTKFIHKIAELVYQEKDYASQTLIQWFVDEQIEEEKQTLEVCDALKMIGEDKAAVYMLNKQLGKREE